jgi:hypothetical protein
MELGTRIRGLAGCLAVVVAGVAFGCSEAREEAEKVSEVVRENPKDAVEVYEDTYEEKRKKGEGRVDAAGDAYNAVLEVPKERAEAEQ